MAEITLIDPALRRSVNLFGPIGWRLVACFRFFMDWSLAAKLFALMAFWLLLLSLAICTAKISTLAAVIAWLAIGVGLFILLGMLLFGLSSVARLKKVLGALLQRRMFPNDPTRVVRMSDFGGARPALKIVSANLHKQKLELFSADRTPNVSVADAVAASICLPVVFRPWKIESEMHIDGGVVSNLPAWPFDEERELDPGAKTIAIEIGERQSSPSLGYSMM